MDLYTYWLDRVKKITKKEKFILLREYGTAKEIHTAPMAELAVILGNIEKAQLLTEQKHSKEIEKEYERLLEKGIKFCSFLEEEYPKRLRDIPDPPLTLYYLGELPKEDILSVAVIGARECSEYGKYVAKELGKYLGEMGVQVISGMARGVDGISQSAAMEAGGLSFGVLGCGVDICYPKENKEIYNRLMENGGILSSYYPETPPQPYLFPPRNRIVSGLSDAIVVVEARQKSGTLITVDMALEQARDVYVVPGRVTDRLSDGCNQLLKDGAHVFLNPSDFLKRLLKDCPSKRLASGKVSKEETAAGTELPVEERTLYEILDITPKSIEEIRREMMAKKGEEGGRELAEKLMKLCMMGYCKQTSPGWFQKMLQ